MGYMYKEITIAGINHLYQCDSQWGAFELGGGPETICDIGCCLTSTAMALKTTPKVLYDRYGMTDELVNWTKLPSKAKIGTKTTFSIPDLFSKLVVQGKPVIIQGSGHWGCVYGFKGTVALDPDGYITGPGPDVTLSNFLVHDPRGYNDKNLKDFDSHWPLLSIRTAYATSPL